MTKQEILEAYGDEEILFADGFDEAIIGIDTDMRVVYDADTVIEILINRDHMTEEEALEFADFNIFGAKVGDQTPIYVYV